MKLNADLVKLSACDGASGTAERVAGTDSLVQAFLMAGACSVVASAWQADDTFTATLMRRFYANLHNGHDKAEALTPAKRELLKEWGPSARPIYWTGFRIFALETAPASPQLSCSSCVGQFWRIQELTGCHERRYHIETNLQRMKDTYGQDRVTRKFSGGQPENCPEFAGIEAPRQADRGSGKIGDEGDAPAPEQGAKYAYRIYGLKLESDSPVFGPAACAPGSPDVVIGFISGQSSCSEPGGRLVHRGDAISIWHQDEGYRFSYGDGYEYLISQSGDRITVSIPPGGCLEDAGTYLVGPIMGFVLRLHGVVCLHASAVVADGRAVAFCGAAGAGKSTIAAAFALQGVPVLAEDVAALWTDSSAIVLQPGYPRVNLWPDSATALCGEPGRLPAITPTWSKRYLPLDAAGGTTPFYPEPASLSAIYVLGSRIAGKAPEICPLGLMDALIALASNTYTSYALDRGMKAREFELLKRVVRSVPIRSISLPEEIAYVGEACRALVQAPEVPVPREDPR